LGQPETTEPTCRDPSEANAMDQAQLAESMNASLARQFGRFALVGVSNTILSFVSYSILVTVGVSTRSRARSPSRSEPRMATS
jgi:hypothetical protein